MAREWKNVTIIEINRIKQVERVLEFLLGLGWKSNDEINSDFQIIVGFFKCLQCSNDIIDCIGTSHKTENTIVSRLNRGINIIHLFCLKISTS